MAILKNLWVNNTRKKLAGAVLYKSKGQQIARELAGNVANPRTRQQMTQRIRLANLVAMYRANKSWMDKYAFENKKQTWSVYNAFVSANISGSQVALTKSEAAAGACVVAPYKMTDGSLPQVQIYRQTESPEYGTDLYIGDLTIISTTTIGDLSAALIANNNGIVNGMQLSLIENEQEVVNEVPRVVVRAYEFIINSSDTTLLSEKWGSEGLTTYVGSNYNAIGYSTLTGASAFTFILSHTFGGKTHVGASYMVLADSAVYDSYITSTAVDLAVQSYGSGNSTPFLDSTEANGVEESGPSGDVPYQGSITSIGGVTPGQYYGRIDAHNVEVADFSTATMVVQFNNAVTSGVRSAKIIDSSNAENTIEHIGYDGDGAVYLDTDELGSSNSSILKKIVLVIGSVEVDASFDTSDNGVTE